MKQNVFLRYEQKYLIDSVRNQQLMQMLSEHMQPDLYGLTRIDSLYLDTPSHLLTRQSIEGPLYKEKLRIRTYGLGFQSQSDDLRVFLEQKKKLKGVVYKRRLETTMAEAHALIDLAANGGTEFDIALDWMPNSQIASELFWAFKRYQPLQPFLQISCDRLALTETGNNQHDLRITFDRNLFWQFGEWDFSSAPDHEFPLKDQTLMEIKVTGSYPLWLSRVLDELAVYPTSFSKVGNAYKYAYQEGLLS